MHESWIEKLKPLREMAVESWRQVAALNEVTYPLSEDVFNAFKMPYEKVKVIIIGQDPYHGAGQANGLAFSVNKGITIPPSLDNIYKELNSDLNIKMPKHGDLSNWVDQGVLLLNSTLTVSHGRPASHQHLGWQDFTTKVIKILSEDKDSLVFMLWGNHALEKVKGIDINKHYVIKSTHPSPYSAEKSTKQLKAFFGSKPFSECNQYLKFTKQEIINWEIE